MKKRITIFGSTGSIGESTLDIISDHFDLYEVVGLTINCNYKKLHEQVKKFNPKVVSINNNEAYKNFLSINTNQNLKVLNGNDSLIDIIVQSIQDVKGNNISLLDLREIENRVSDQVTT